MRKILSLLMMVVFSVAMFAATETTVYYTASSDVIGTYTLKLNTHQQTTPENKWETYVMKKTDLSYNGDPVYSASFTDLWDGVQTMQFQLYDGDTWKSQDEPITSWTSASTYNGKMYVHSTGKWEAVPEPGQLNAVSVATTWDFAKLTANTGSTLYNSSDAGIKLNETTSPSKTDEVIYSEYGTDILTIGDGFDGASIAFKGEYPIRKNKYCQNGVLHFKAGVAGTIVVKFSDTGSKASATAVKRYLVVNDEQTEYWTSRENNGSEPYAAQLDVTTGAIPVEAGDVTIKGTSAITVYTVTFEPKAEEQPNYYIIGAGEAFGNWSFVPVYGETFEIENLAAGDYMFRLAMKAGDWSKDYGYNQLTEKPEGVTKNNDNNICFTYKKPGSFKVTYNGKLFAVEGNFYVAPIELPVVALAGEMNKWTVTDEYIFAPADDKKTASLTIKVEEARTDSFKIKVGDKLLSAFGGDDASYVVKRGWPRAIGVNKEFILNMVIIFDQAGDYTFTWTYANDSLEVTYPDKTIPQDAQYFLQNNWEGKEWAWKQAMKQGDGTFKLENVVFGGNGVDYNTAAENNDNKIWVGIDAIQVADGKTIGALDTVTFVLDPAKNILYATILGKYQKPAQQDLEDGFYLIGQNGWDEAALNASLKFELNKENNKEYMLTTTLVENQNLKVVKVEGNKIVKWYPEGEGNHYVVDAYHAGDSKTIYFQETSKEDWSAFGGFFYIPENTVTIFVVLTTQAWETVYAYIWKVVEGQEIKLNGIDFPGIQIFISNSHAAGMPGKYAPKAGENVYSYECPMSYDHVIFSNGTSDEQTENLTWIADKPYFVLSEAKDGDGKYSGEWKHDLPTAIDNVFESENAVKVMLNGQIYILRGGKTYTIQGQLVR